MVCNNNVMHYNENITFLVWCKPSEVSPCFVWF